MWHGTTAGGLHRWPGTTHGGGEDLSRPRSRSAPVAVPGPLQDLSLPRRGLQRIGFPQSAIKSWISCQRLNKRGPTRKMLSRYTNCYGMDRQDSSDADDWQAFSSIQIARYLLGKNKRTFSTQAEHDMLLDLVRDSWEALKRSQDMAGLRL